jgi:hypothetical protein
MPDPNQPLEPKPAFDIPLPFWAQWTLVSVVSACILAVIIYMGWVEVKRRRK